MIRFSCSACSKTLKAADHGTGRKVSCPRCGERLVVPSPIQDKTGAGQPGSEIALAAPPLPQWVVQELEIADELEVVEELEIVEGHPASAPTSAGGTSSVDKVSPAPQPKRLDRVLAIFGLQRASKETPRPADGDKESPTLPVPRFTKEGALVRCPLCNQLQHIVDDQYNKPISCSKCKMGIMAVVASPGMIPMDCPDCGRGLEIEERAAGKTVPCYNCGATVQVPVEPIMMKADKPAAGRQSGSVPWEVVGGVAKVSWLVMNLLADKSSAKGSRTCAKCGRFIRNPFGYCYICQKERGK